MIGINEKFKYLLIIIGISAVTIIVYTITSAGKIVGGIVYFEEKNTLKYLVVTTKNSERWIFPKGKVKYFEFYTHAVSREVVEEAGVNANISFKLQGNPFIYRKTSGKQQSIELYAMKYMNEAQRWKEKNKRKRKWLSFSEANNVLSPELGRALKEVQSKLIKH